MIKKKARPEKIRQTKETKKIGKENKNLPPKVSKEVIKKYPKKREGRQKKDKKNVKKYYKAKKDDKKGN